MELQETAVTAIRKLINKSEAPKPLIFFDLETTGVNVGTDKIVQVAYVKIYPDSTDIDENCMLINPGMIVPQDAIDVHGITNEMLVGKLTFNEVANELLSVFSGCNVAGYNSDRFDVVLLSEEFARCGLAWPSDTEMLDAYKIEAMLNPRTLTGVYSRYFGVDISEQAHDALVDTKATMHVFSKQLEALDKMSTGGKYTITDISNLVNKKKMLDVAEKIAYNDSGVAVFNFGKFKGQPLTSNMGYVNWMLSSEFPESTKQAIRNYLKL